MPTQLTITLKYVTADDYLAYFGIDLATELPDNDNPGAKVVSFIARVERLVEGFLKTELFREWDYDTFTQDQQTHFVYGILEQIHYMLRNGDISSDSGYEPTQGKISDRNYLQGIVIAPNAVREFILAGVWSRKLNHGRDWLDYGY
jgi:hypothetical protein